MPDSQALLDGWVKWWEEFGDEYPNAWQDPLRKAFVAGAEFMNKIAEEGTTEHSDVPPNVQPETETPEPHGVQRLSSRGEGKGESGISRPPSLHGLFAMLEGAGRLQSDATFCFWVRMAQELHELETKLKDIQVFKGPEVEGHERG